MSGYDPADDSRKSYDVCIAAMGEKLRSFRREQIGDATLYLGDCRDILPLLNRVDLVCTDPPYGIGFKGYETHKDLAGDYESLLRPLVGHSVALLQYPEEMMRLVCPVLGAPDDCLAWVYPSNLPRQFRLWGLWGVRPNFANVPQPARNPEVSKVVNLSVSSYDWWEQPQVKNTSPEKEDHPCQVPVTCVERVLRLVDAATVLDPFLGSGTTGVAAARLGRKFIGIEIEPKYFDIACRRIDEAYRQPRLFKDEAPKPKQEALL